MLGVILNPGGRKKLDIRKSCEGTRTKEEGVGEIGLYLVFKIISNNMWGYHYLQFTDE